MKKLILAVTLACAAFSAMAQQANLPNIPPNVGAMCSHVYEVAHMAAQARTWGETLPKVQGEFTHPGDKGEVAQVFQDPDLRGHTPDDVAASLRMECLAYTGALGKPHDMQ
ncbi:hypothetical protein [Paraburkholderia sediminicola]|uniref:hypothetical protein n=1 Tax=Paraburkholderia sediminicola TaxID=458836 RepID=UPI0038B7B8E2